MFLVRGHRGVGKSSFLKRIKHYFPAIRTIDLDAYVEEKENKSITNIFMERGEKYFRELEQKYLSEIYESHDPQKNEILVVSLGGGYQGDLPADVMQIMLARKTDKEGRIFFDRPRIKEGEGELEESRELFELRNESYRSKSHFILELEEGFEFPNSEERKLLEALFYPEEKKLGTLTNLYFCLSSSCINNLLHKELEQELYKRLPIDRFEIRSDIESSLGHIRKLISILGEDKLLLSVRSFDSQQSFQDLKEEFPELLLDWDIKFGAEVLRVEPDIVSNHPGSFKMDSLGSFVEFEAKFPDATMKLACEFDNTGDLMEALHWQKKEADKRCLFPISKEGDWQWLRLYLNFLMLL
jgi:shikimate kinase